MSNIKKVLIIGGNGFIGENLSSYLKDSGFEVTSFDIRLPQNQTDNIKYVKGNFFDENDLFDAINNQNMIVHAISTITPGNSDQKYMNGYEKDFLQSVKLFEKVIENDQKLLFLSSGGTVYGNQNTQPIIEETIPHPINHYGNVKLCIENVIRLFNRQYKSNLKIARISNPYGPGHNSEKGIGFLDTALKNAMLNKPIEIWGKGKNIRDYVYISDVCTMLGDILLYDGEIDVFNVSTGIGTSQLEIIDKIKRLGYKPEVKFCDSRDIDTGKNILDNSRIMEFSSCRPLLLDEGLNKYHNYLSKVLFNN